MPAHGDGTNGVLIVLEAAGEDEEQQGVPVVGRAGQYLFSQLKRNGIEREGFRIHNVLSCRPPDNKLHKMPYTDEAIRKCAPNLDATIAEHVKKSLSLGKTPTIVALGKFSFKRLMGIEYDHHPILKEDYFTYPHWLPKYSCWMVAAPHPSHIMQGKHNLAPTMVFAVQRALEIAAEGIVVEQHDYLLDPDPITFAKWIDEYKAALAAGEEVYMSYDIETPYKSGADEAELAREDDDDYSILRCAFCYKPGKAVSVPWQAEWMGGIERIFLSGGMGINWNGSVYDDPRIQVHTPIHLNRLDGMLAWHVLNTSLPKGLGYVTPFYWKNTSMWKHLSDAEPAFYNAKDADAALRAFIGIKKDLVTHDLWKVFDRHVVQLNEVLGFMSREGVLLDHTSRNNAEDKLATLLEEIDAKIQTSVPLEARRLKLFKKVPKDTTGLVVAKGTRKARTCPRCGVTDVTALHFKSIGKKALARGEDENPCAGLKATKVELVSDLWAEVLPFKLSNKSMQAYLNMRKHKPITDRKTKKITFDIKSIKQLVLQHPEDPLYPVIGDFRKTQKLLGTYIGKRGMRKVNVPDDYVLKEGESWV